MIRLLFLISLLCLLLNCKPKNQVYAKVENHNDSITLFDTIIFAKAIEASLSAGLSENYITIEEWDHLGNITVYILYDYEDNIIIKSDSLTIVQIRTSNGYREERYVPNSHFIEFYNFYQNGNISSKGKIFNNDLLVGKYYQYNKSGKPTIVKDYDEGYTFTPDSVLRFVQKRMPDETSIFFKAAKKLDSNDNPIWVLSWRKYYNSYDVTLDGRTGKIISDVVK